MSENRLMPGNIFSPILRHTYSICSELKSLSNSNEPKRTQTNSNERERTQIKSKKIVEPNSNEIELKKQLIQRTVPFQILELHFLNFETHLNSLFRNKMNLQRYLQCSLSFLWNSTQSGWLSLVSDSGHVLAETSWHPCPGIRTLASVSRPCPSLRASWQRKQEFSCLYSSTTSLLFFYDPLKYLVGEDLLGGFEEVAHAPFSSKESFNSATIFSIPPWPCGFPSLLAGFSRAC